MRAHVAILFALINASCSNHSTSTSGGDSPDAAPSPGMRDGAAPSPADAGASSGPGTYLCECDPKFVAAPGSCNQVGSFSMQIGNGTTLTFDPVLEHTATTVSADSGQGSYVCTSVTSTSFPFFSAKPASGQMCSQSYDNGLVLLYVPNPTGSGAAPVVDLGSALAGPSPDSGFPLVFDYYLCTLQP